MNIQKEINSILEKFIIHLYDDFDFEEAKLKIECELKIQSELKDYYYTEEELYDMYWFGNKYVRDKFLINNNNSNYILQQIESISIQIERLLLYYRKYYGSDAEKLINKLIQQAKSIEEIIISYLTFYYCENEEKVKIIVYSFMNTNTLK